MHALLTCGLLHSDTLGSILACRSPRLFAAYRVLLRLLMPRHPPCALISLNAFLQNYVLFLFQEFLLGRSFEIVISLFSEVLLLSKLDILNFLFVVSLFNFQRSSISELLSLHTLEHLKFSGDIWWRLRESNP